MIEETMETVEFVEEKGGIYFRSILLAKAGMRVPQHQHDVRHATYCGSGSALFYVDGELVQTVLAGHAVEIEPEKAHLFEALEDNTRLTCVFDAEATQLLKAKGY